MLVDEEHSAMPVTRPRSCRQNCSNRLAGTFYSQNAKKTVSNRAAANQENTSATSNLTLVALTRPRDVDRLGAASIAVTVDATPASALVHRPVPQAISSTFPAGRSH
jgi:hypothetical protein